MEFGLNIAREYDISVGFADEWRPTSPLKNFRMARGPLAFLWTWGHQYNERLRELNLASLETNKTTAQWYDRGF